MKQVGFTGAAWATFQGWRAGARDPLAFLLALHRHGGDVVLGRLPGFTGAAAFDATSVQHVLVDGASGFSKRTPQYDRVRQLLGDGLITSEGEVWREQRRVVQPEFRPDRFGALCTFAVEVADAVAADWMRQRGTADVWRDLASATLDVALRVILGLRTPPNPDLIGAVTACLDALTTICLTPLPWAASLPIPAARRFKHARASLDGLIDGLVDRRREAGGFDGDVLGLLLAAEKDSRSDPANLRHQILTLLLAGYETTASSLTWAVHLLGQNPAIGHAVAEEARAVLGAGRSGMEAVSQLELTSRVVLEALRLYPPIWALTRRAEVATRLGDHPLPAGTIVLISPWVTHRDPRVWDEPDRFDPGRFSPEALLARRASGVPRMAFCPFGGGARQCVGDRFALAQLTLMLAALSRGVAWRSPPGPSRIAASVTIRPEPAFRLAATRSWPCSS